MNINSILTIAGSGLNSTGQQLAVISQNVANANTPGYAAESVSQTSVVADGVGIGVRTGVATRNVDVHLQADANAAAADAAGQKVAADSLNAIDAASGTPGSGSDLPGLLGALKDAFSGLSADPSNATQQRKVVQQAGALAQGINGLSLTIAKARQATQDKAVEAVVTANTALRTIGILNTQIVAAASRGSSTATLEDQRDINIQQVTKLTGAKFLHQSDGTTLAALKGLVLPLDAKTGPFSLASAPLSAATGAGSAPGLLLNGQDVTADINRGQLGALLALRDQTLPSLQSSLDGFASSLASGFNAQGVQLFTDPSGAIPAGAGAGLTIQVSAAAQSNPAIVRDGGSPSGLAGDPTLINSVLGGVLRGGAGTVTDQALTVTSTIASLAADASAKLTTQQGVSTALSTRLASSEGVSVDSELASLVQLQNSYAANAKVLASTDTIWSELLAAVRL